MREIFKFNVYVSGPVHGLDELDSEGSLMLADAIRLVTANYEKRLGPSYAYMMVFHQAPSKGDGTQNIASMSNSTVLRWKRGG